MNQEMNYKFSIEKNLYMNIVCKQSGILLFLAIFFVFPQFLAGQGEIQREVRVVKPYTPTLSDAEKINLLPDFNDTLSVSPDFEYRIFPRRYDTHFRVRPIKPARMVGLPLERLYKSQLTLGMGNYLTPMAELAVSQLRSRKSSLGLYLRHHSSAGKIKLDNDDKVNANYSDNTAELFGKIIYPRSVLEGKITGGYNSKLFYGFNTEIDTVLAKDDIRQKIYSAGASGAFYSTHPDSFHTNYSVGMDYNYTLDAFSNDEHGLKVEGGISKYLGDWYSGVDIGFDYYKKSESLDSSDNYLVHVNPYVSKSSGDWRFLIGLNTTADVWEDGTLYVYPRARFEFHIVKDVLIPYMGVNGYREVNNYRKMLFENPFIKPGLHVQNTNHSLIGYVGLKGRYSSRMAFDLKVSYSSVENMYFFINDSLNDVQNQFMTVYDDLSILNFGGEVTWNHNESLKFVLKGNYYQYQLNNLEQPWHKPQFETSLSGIYNLRDKILVDADIFYTGKRYIPDNTIAPAEPVQMDGFIDANLAVEYRYTKLLSFFLKFRNLSASQYDIWYRYPAQRFQVMAGFSYAL